MRQSGENMEQNGKKHPEVGCQHHHLSSEAAEISDFKLSG
jgi:hypothetical protein